jgi:hypothetical protein
MLASPVVNNQTSPLKDAAGESGNPYPPSLFPVYRARGAKAGLITRNQFASSITEEAEKAN